MAANLLIRQPESHKEVTSRRDQDKQRRALVKRTKVAAYQFAEHDNDNNLSLDFEEFLAMQRTCGCLRTPTLERTRQHCRR